VESLRQIFIDREIQYVFEVREGGILGYEMDLEVFEPYYSGLEGFWTDGKSDWVIYASHESSIAIGGWLLSEVKDAWPNWQDRIWTSPFFD
jgi:hypothetical protein